MAKVKKNEVSCAVQEDGTTYPHWAKLAKWQVKLAARLGMLDAPGVYPLVLIVGDDGRRSLVVELGKKEELGT